MAPNTSVVACAMVYGEFCQEHQGSIAAHTVFPAHSLFVLTLFTAETYRTLEKQRRKFLRIDFSNLFNQMVEIRSVYLEILRTVLVNSDEQKALDLRTRVSVGDLTWAVEPTFMLNGNMLGVLGAYDDEGQHIYLNSKLLFPSEGLDTLAAVYHHEMGHHVAKLIGHDGSAGDVGILFHMVLHVPRRG